jgi:hypothetical protein
MDSPDPVALKDFLAVVGWLVGIAVGAITLVVQVRNLLKKPSKTPQPLIVEMAEKFATVGQHAELSHKVEAYHKDILAKLTDLDGIRRDSVHKAHLQTERLYSEVRTELREEMDKIRAEFHTGMAGLNERISTLIMAVGETRGELRRTPSNKA